MAHEFRTEYLQKIEKRVNTYDFKILNQPRDGKKLLVLDVDYTLFGEQVFCYICICFVEQNLF